MRECTAKPPTRVAPTAQLGDSNVGKSSLVLRFVKNQFNAEQVTTVGAAFLQCPVPQEDSDDKIQFGIWDTAGSERYKALAPMVRRAPAAEPRKGAASSSVRVPKTACAVLPGCRGGDRGI